VQKTNRGAERRPPSLARRHDSGIGLPHGRCRARTDDLLLV